MLIFDWLGYKFILGKHGERIATTHTPKQRIQLRKGKIKWVGIAFYAIGVNDQNEFTLGKERQGLCS